ncbi:PEP-CTERM sorting domain-containing protein [Aquisphaera insulae]|uniref:PEP-CTERM sorting domain-containing protein n=1 Tax=Aquisphaera insulae TaxID=2712864 RepID=UPI0013EB50DB|nr:PEP-CTERM sorting domain-containing protein [Aquisphaera insulae]
MRNGTRRGVAAIWVASVAILGACGNASGSPLKLDVTYSTTGTIDPVTYAQNDRFAPAPVVFRGIEGGSYSASSPFSLGQFEVVRVAPGDGASNVRSPFTIVYQTTAVDGVAPTINESHVELHGWIYGTIDANGTPHLQALFDQGGQMTDPNYYFAHPAPPFRTDGWINTISVNDTKEFLALSATGSLTPISARIEMVPVPEPGSLALFLTLLAATAYRIRPR